ncbi:MAG: carbonate dehydratase [Verrucomicrobiota bacterium]|nr:carbonate dehydratase [Verrucomicrobiota bacterium]
MNELEQLFANNRRWAERIRRQDPEFFPKLARQQSPSYLWIGCSDSRVPANEIVDLLPGELFVHRNVANLVVEGDLNCMSAIQFAVDLLKVQHIIVCGHYGCSGVQAAWQGAKLGLSDAWLEHVHHIRAKHEQELAAAGKEGPARLCELNVIEQVATVCRSAIVTDAWARAQPLAVHGWIYGLRDGLLRDLNVTASSKDEAKEAYDRAIKRPSLS